MKIINLIFFFLFCVISGQKNIAFDSLKLKETKDFFADDYGDFYFYKNKDFTFTKFDSTGLQQGKIMFTLPFKVQSVENPLNIFAFSENAQEMRLYDENLVEIQKVNFRENFSFVVMAFGADLQYIWLLEDSTKRLIKYRFRDKNIQESYLMNFSFEGIKDLIVFKNKLFLLRGNEFSVYDFQNRIVFKTEIEEGQKLRRENGDFYIIGKNKIYKWNSTQAFIKVFEAPDAKIVDKNSTKYVALVRNKLYLYKIKKE